MCWNTQGLSGAGVRKVGENGGGNPLQTYLDDQKKEFSKRKFSKDCQNWFKDTFGVSISDVQKYAGKKMTLVNGIQSDDPYAGTTMSDFMNKHHYVGFVAPFANGTKVYYNPWSVEVGQDVQADFAHEILHKLNKDWTDDILLPKVGKDPKDLSSWISKAIRDHCF